MLQALASAFLLLVATVASADAVVERVRFESLALDRDGGPAMLNAVWFRPAGTADRAIPAVIALHGCGGMYSIAKGRREELSLRHRNMAELLVAQGYAVLFPDSFRSRGREEICTLALAERPITVAHRRLDALGALVYLQSRADVDRERIALLGWSHGGSTVLAAMNARNAVVQRVRAAEPKAPFVRAAIAFYPGCMNALRAREGYAPAAPMLLLVGAADDWTSPKPCIALVSRLESASLPARIVVYPDTYHGFDGPSTQQRLRLDVPGGVHPGKGVTVAVNPAAREDAYARVQEFLRSTLP